MADVGGRGSVERADPAAISSERAPRSTRGPHRALERLAVRPAGARRCTGRSSSSRCCSRSSTRCCDGTASGRPASSASTTTCRVLTDPDLRRRHPQRLQAGRLLQRHAGRPGAARGLASSAGSHAGRSGSTARTVLFLPQVIPLVAAGIVWSWMLSTTGVVNQFLTAIGLGGITRSWLADFGLALPAVGRHRCLGAAGPVHASCC